MELMEGFVDAIGWVFYLLMILIIGPGALVVAGLGAFIVTTSPFWFGAIIIWFLKKLRLIHKDFDTLDKVLDKVLGKVPEEYFQWYGILSAAALLLYIGLPQTMFVEWIGYLAKHLGIA